MAIQCASRGQGDHSSLQLYAVATPMGAHGRRRSALGVDEHVVIKTLIFEDDANGSRSAS